MKSCEIDDPHALRSRPRGRRRPERRGRPLPERGTRAGRARRGGGARAPVRRRRRCSHVPSACRGARRSAPPCSAAAARRPGRRSTSVAEPAGAPGERGDEDRVHLGWSSEPREDLLAPALAHSSRSGSARPARRGRERATGVRDGAAVPALACARPPRVPPASATRGCRRAMRPSVRPRSRRTRRPAADRRARRRDTAGCVRLPASSGVGTTMSRNLASRHGRSGSRAAAPKQRGGCLRARRCEAWRALRSSSSTWTAAAATSASTAVGAAQKVHAGVTLRGARTRVLDQSLGEAGEQRRSPRAGRSGSARPACANGASASTGQCHR